MRFLVDANLPRRTVFLVREMGFEAMDVRDAGLGAASDEEIAELARAQDSALVTRDYDFADTRNYPPEQHAGILVLSMPKDATADTILAALSRFLRQGALVADLPGRLAIIEASRVRFRPA